MVLLDVQAVWSTCEMFRCLWNRISGQKVWLDIAICMSFAFISFPLFVILSIHIFACNSDQRSILLRACMWDMMVYFKAWTAMWTHFFVVGVVPFEKQWNLLHACLHDAFSCSGSSGWIPIQASTEAFHSSLCWNGLLKLVHECLIQACAETFGCRFLACGDMGELAAHMHMWSATSLQRRCFRWEVSSGEEDFCMVYWVAWGEDLINFCAQLFCLDIFFVNPALFMSEIAIQSQQREYSGVDIQSNAAMWWTVVVVHHEDVPRSWPYLATVCEVTESFLHHRHNHFLASEPHFTLYFLPEYLALIFAEPPYKILSIVKQAAPHMKIHCILEYALFSTLDNSVELVPFVSLQHNLQYVQLYGTDC